MSSCSRPSDADFIFHYDRILGEGSFSAVLLATERRTGKRWAVKTMELAQLQRNKMQDYAYRERNALNLLNERPWSPSLLLSFLAESNSQMRCNSIAEEHEEDNNLEVISPSSAADDDAIIERKSSEDKNDNDDAAKNALHKEQRQLLQQQRKHRRMGSVTSPSGRQKKTRNPFFVELHSSFASAGHFFLVLSHAVNGDLLQFLKSRGSFSLPVARFYLAEIVSAVHHLHSIGIIHRDLKPENILLGADMHILIADFGSCKILHHSPLSSTVPQHQNQEQQLQRPARTSISPTRCLPNLPLPVGSSETGSSTSGNRHRKSSGGSVGDSRTLRPRVASFVGTAQYVSPEMIKGRPEEKASDLWALGCILYHFLTGEFPFVGPNDHRVFQKIQALDFQCPTFFDPVAKDLVRKLIVLDPASRLGSGSGGFASLIRHPFFHTVDWETLHLQTPPLRPDDLKDLKDRKDLSLPVINEQSTPGFSKNSLISASLKLEEDDEEEEEAFELVTSKRRKSSASRPISQPQAVPNTGGNLSNEPLASSSSPDASSLTPTALPSSPASSGSSSSQKRTPPSTASTGAWTASSTVPLILEILDLSLEEKRRKREQQMKENVYHRLVEGNLILKSGILEKKRHAHYPTRKRMFLLTEGPHLFYVDPDKKQLKGKVPWSPTMATKYLSFKKFEIQTPNRTYDLLDPLGGAIDWCQCLDAVKEKFFFGIT